MLSKQACFTSNRGDWQTPPQLFEGLNATFGFTLDAAASASNTLCRDYIDAERDALAVPWDTDGAIWLNPPYGPTVGKWVAKAYAESLRGRTVVLLLPARTDTRWFHDFVLPHGEILFLRGRLRFLVDGAEPLAAAPFPSMVVVFHGATRESHVEE